MVSDRIAGPTRHESRLRFHPDDSKIMVGGETPRLRQSLVAPSSFGETLVGCLELAFSWKPSESHGKRVRPVAGVDSRVENNFPEVQSK